MNRFIQSKYRCLRCCILQVSSVLLSGCTLFSDLPEGEVPKNLVRQEQLQNNGMTRKNAEAAICGAIVRTLIRRGHTSGRVAVALPFDGSVTDSFRILLSGTNMIRFSSPDSAVYFLMCSTKGNDWTVQLLQKDGTVIFQKTVSITENL